LRVDGLESIGFVAPVDLAVAQADYGEAFRDSHAGAVPPVTADCAAGYVWDATEADNLVDVSVSLEDGEDVVLFEQWQHVIRVGDHQLGMRGWGCCAGPARAGRRCVGIECCDERDMAGDHDWRSLGKLGEVSCQPLKLGGVDARFPGAVGRDLNSVEHDEVIALVIKGVVGRAESLLKYLFAVAGASSLNAALGEDPEVVVVADGVMDLEAQGLFGMRVEVEEAVGSFAVHGEGIEDVITALDGEIGVQRGRLAKGHCASVGCGQFRFEMRVGEEDVIE